MSGRLSRLILAMAVLLGAAAAAMAQTTASIDPASKRGELARLESQIEVSRATVNRLTLEVQVIEADQLKLRADLVDTGKRMREAETRILSAEGRMNKLADDEERLRTSLQARQGLLAEVLATLQRMGRRPPPALFVRPGDALDAIRTAMLLGAVLPDMRQETQALVADLAELARVREQLASERDAVRIELIALAEDRKRIDLLVESRHAQKAAEESAIEAEKQREAALAREAATLKDLISKIEKAAGTGSDAGAPLDLRGPLAALDDPNRLAPSRRFEDVMGTVPLPVIGAQLRAFGQADGLGGVEKGVSFVTRASATVSSPCDGWIMYAGPFRSYGQLLIINAGDGYHIVLAGMNRINVNPGQFVLTGEPVGIMGSGEARVASNGATSGATPTLYIEFRKDNVSIDPTPWWANQGEKARG